MTKKIPFDIRVVNYMTRKLNDYAFQKKKKESARLKEVWLKKFKSSDYIIHRLRDDLKIRLYKDSILSKFIYEGFEKSEIEFLNVFLSEGDCFVDIGANVGLFSLFASKKVGKTGSVISFEPAQVTYERFLENLELNKISNVIPFKLGLSDEDGILELNISANGYEAWNTFVKSNDNKFSLKELVPVRSFDNFFQENSVVTDNIALIKLDVEGFEINVLKGAATLLSKENAPVFMVEFTDMNALNAGHCCHELYKLLITYGYSWYVYNSLKKQLIYEPIQLNYPYNNLIAIKNVEEQRIISKFIVVRND
jgi:FkbM family methyltransferase